MAPVDTPAVAAVPKRRRLEVAEAPPPAIITPCRAQKKCEGYIHVDLLELHVIPLAHIKHCLKPAMFLMNAGSVSHLVLNQAGWLESIHPPKLSLTQTGNTDRGGRSVSFHFIVSSKQSL